MSVVFIYVLVVVMSCSKGGHDYLSALDSFQREVKLFDTTFTDISVVYDDEPIDYNVPVHQSKTKQIFKKYNINYDDFGWEAISEIDSFQQLYPNFKSKSKIVESTYRVNRDGLMIIDGVNVSAFPRETDTLNAAFLSISVPVFSKDYQYCFYIKSMSSPGILATCYILYKKEKNKWIKVESYCQ